MVFSDPQVLAALPQLAWPLILLLAWAGGEMAYRLLGLPRISSYALVGVLAAPTQLGWLPPSETMSLAAHVGFGLLLFELGHRINLRWFAHNPWLGLSALLDGLLSFVAIGLLARSLGFDAASSALMGALGMATSPAALVRVINEERASGQIAERLMHLALVACVLAVMVFKAVLAVHVFNSSGSLVAALYTGAWSLLLSLGLGVLAGLLVTALLRLPAEAPDATLPYALAVVAVVALTHGLQLSPIVAALSLGLTARHRRVVFSRSERGFGGLGELLSVALFVYLGAKLDLAHVGAGLAVGLGIVATRLLLTPALMAAFGPLTGVNWRKGALTGLGLMPLSAFVLLLLEQSQHLQMGLLERLAPLAAAALVLEIAGPLCTRWALRWGGESDGGRR